MRLYRGSDEPDRAFAGRDAAGGTGTEADADSGDLDPAGYDDCASEAEEPPADGKDPVVLTGSVAVSGLA